MEIDYPSKRFIAKGKGLVNKDSSFSVRINTNYRRRLVLKGAPFLLDEDGKVESAFTMLGLFLLMPGFLVVHFYAAASGYRCDISDEEYLILTYRAGEKGG